MVFLRLQFTSGDEDLRWMGKLERPRDFLLQKFGYSGTLPTTSTKS